ncbi:MAG: endonuclease MutS2, partial [Thermodesulfovibrionales bacterium]
MEREALKSLEFYKVIEEIAGYCHSQATKTLIRNIFPFSDLNPIIERFGQIREIMRLRDEGFSLGLYDFLDISGILEKVRPEGAALDPEEILSLLPVLSLIEEVSVVLNGKDLVYLKPFSEGLTGFPSIRSRIKKSIDNDGNIVDSASPTLAELRNRKRSVEKRIKKRLEELVTDKRIAPFLQDDFISMRSGRWVIPVRMDSKGEVKGIVHDVSRSGDTAFIEPVEIMGLSNELENIIAEERVEELRILREISGLIRVESEEIERQFSILITIDLLNSIVLFSERVKAQIPDINESGHLSLCDARHPILLVSREDEEVVPLNIGISTSERVVVISGPNAGGKTVAVKTVGLLTAMALSGIPIPANQSSSIPLVKNIYVDIGDEQSIVDNLSTFSAHVRRISGIFSKAGAEDMVIIDELGTGTEPSQGAALGCAILEELRDRGAIVFATTHLVDIVGFVYSSKGMINASMEFDCVTLSPLYRLKIGEPGESHAFEIAARYGLPESIVEKARSRLGDGADLYKLINELNDKRNNYESLIREGQERIEKLRDQETR